MDVFEILQELHKESTVITTRKPKEKKNGTRIREVTTPTNSRRCSSPTFTRNFNPAPKRAVSTERRRPCTPSSPRPSTPVSDTSAESQLSAKKTAGSRLPEVLWPSTMRSLSVSFQSDSISIPIVKKKDKEKLNNTDRTLKPTCNVAHKQVETSGYPRKLTPERKRSPLKGKNSNLQSENSRPFDSSQSKLIDQLRWPSRLSSNIMTKSVDFNDKSGNFPSSSFPRRLSSEGIPRRLHKTSSDSSEQSDKFDDHIGLSSSQKVASFVPDPLVRSGTVLGSGLPSPSRVSISRALPSLLKTRSYTPTQSRGASPSRIRPSSPTRQSNNTTSVLSFIADNKKGKKNNQLEDVHQLRLLYNRHLQWRFANARAEAVLYIQKITAEVRNFSSKIKLVY